MELTARQTKTLLDQPKGKVDFLALITEAAKARIDCPELAKIRSADASPVIDCRNLDVSKFIVDTLATGRETGKGFNALLPSGEVYSRYWWRL